MASPIPGVAVSTPYGKRGPYWSCNDNGSGGVHTGVDFAASSGTDVFAPIAGEIRHRNYGSSFGSHQFAISPDPGQPFADGEVFFAHMTSRPADGTYVDVGDYLGNVGAEGNVSGPHLHMEYHADTKNQWSCSTHDDPAPVLAYADDPDPLPDPTNPNGVKVGDTVEVTAVPSLNARTSPGGPQRIEDGVPLTRPTGYRFDVKDLENGWASGGTNWYSTDYLIPIDDTPPAKPGWTGPTVILDDPTPDPDRYVSYAQAVVRVGAVNTADGSWPAVYVLGQDYKNAGNLRFYLAHADGRYADQWMQVDDAGHGQTFHAYRSAAGNLYVWCGEDPAYRYKWQPGKIVARSSGTKMDFKGCRPVGSHEPWVGFRDATDTKETFYLFDRTDFTDGTNRTNPAKSVTIAKQTARAQQSWCVDERRIYRISGSTNDNPPNGTNLHVVEVFDWAGAKLLSLDVTKMAISTTSDEPEGLTYTGTPGSVLAGKREGSTDPAKRSYPLWTLVGMP
jgi:hypothetical protein